MKKRAPKFVVIDGCPCPYDVAPYVYLVLRRAKQTAASIYRGDDPDAAKILHRHGKHTQREIHADPTYANISNPAGRSMHDLHSDGVAKLGPVGRVLEPWEVGVDSGGDDEASKRAIAEAARHYGLVIYHPYNRGVEGHHWGFARRPAADGVHLFKSRVLMTRALLRTFR